MATYTHPVTGEVREYTPYAELDFAQIDKVNDSDQRGRIIAAEHGYGLDKLVDHPDWRIRAAVAKQGYGLERLVCDQDALVLIAVADQGYGLDLLVKDWRQSVSLAARKRLRDCGMTIEQWIEANPNKCALPENRIKAQDPTLSGAKAAQKGRSKVEQTGSGPKQ